MGRAIQALLAAALILSLASCRCGEGTEQAGGAATTPDAVERPPAAPSSVTPAANAEPGKRVVCPVCGLEFGADEAAATYEHAGKTYYFLLQDHRDAFAEDPARYLDRPPP